MNRYKPICLLLILLTSVAALSSCGSSKQVVYFQDLKPGETEIKLPVVKAITIRPEDKISIIVNSRDPQLTDLFNLPIMSRQLGQSLRGCPIRLPKENARPDAGALTKEDDESTRRLPCGSRKSQADRLV